MYASAANGCSAGKTWAGPQVEDLDSRIRPWRSFGHYLMQKLDDNAQATLFTDFVSGRQWTGAQFKDKVMAVACALLDKHNFQPGSMVCLSYDNTDHLIILSVAVLVAGGSLASCFYKDPYPELLYLAKKVGPKFLFCHSRHLGWAERLQRDLGYHVVGISMDGEPDSSGPTCFAQLMLYDYVARSKAYARKQLPVACRRDLRQEVALVTMSSGTTGKPKAVSQSHWNCLTDLLYMRSSAGSDAKFAFACCASLDYVSGRLIIFGAIQRGYNAVIMNDFEPTMFLRALEQYKIRNIYLGAASFYNLITHPDVDKYDLSALRSVFPMGAKITYQQELAGFLAKRPNIVEVRQGYGASEFGGASINFMRPQEYLEDANNSGKLLPGFKAKIVDPVTSQLLGPNRQGLLHVMGPTVFPGYYDRERQLSNKKLNGFSESNNNDDDDDDDETSHFIWDSTVFDEQGYYITGDLAHFNDKDELFIVGRHKELMSCRGAKKVLPQELEEVILQHPAVMKVCVLGMPNGREPTLQCPRAFVVLKPEYYDESNRQSLELRPNLGVRNDGLKEEELKREVPVHEGQHALVSMSREWRHALQEDLMGHVNERVGWEKQLTGGIVLLDDIPTSRTTGKVNKNYLRSLTLEQVEIYGDRSR